MTIEILKSWLLRQTGFSQLKVLSDAKAIRDKDFLNPHICHFHCFSYFSFSIIFFDYFHIFASDSFLTLVSERCEGCQSVKQTDMVQSEAECESARQTDMVWPQSPLMNNLGSHVNNFSILNQIFLKKLFTFQFLQSDKKLICCNKHIKKNNSKLSL